VRRPHRPRAKPQKLDLADRDRNPDR
jgi:hypothetical protein